MLFQLFKDPIALVIFLAGVVIAVTIHEFAHAWTATRLGDYTAKYHGRLTLNPSKHFDILGILFILFAGFGWGKPVPVNINALRGRYDELKIAIAGPLSNIVFASLIIFIISVANQFGYLAEYSLIRFALDAVIFINLALAIFNLLPIYPLDGSRIWISIAPESMKDQVSRFRQMGPMLLLLFIVITYAFGINIISPVVTWGYQILSAIITVFVYYIIYIVKIIISLF